MRNLFALLCLMLVAQQALAGQQKYPVLTLHINASSLSAQALVAVQPYISKRLPPLDNKIYKYSRIYSPRRTYCRALEMAFGRAESAKLDHFSPQQNYKDMKSNLVQIAHGVAHAVYPNPTARWWLLSQNLEKRIVHLIYFDPRFSHIAPGNVSAFDDVALYCRALPNHWDNK